MKEIIVLRMFKNVHVWMSVSDGVCSLVGVVCIILRTLPSRHLGRGCQPASAGALAAGPPSGLNPRGLAASVGKLGGIWGAVGAWLSGN